MTKPLWEREIEDILRLDEERKAREALETARAILAFIQGLNALLKRVRAAERRLLKAWYTSM